MLTDETLIRQVIKLYEEKTGWGDSTQWSNQDFLQLSELIREGTDVTISHVTLKRIWGKVKYESLPNTHTLNTLVQFLGYENWRDFAVKQNAGGTPAGGSVYAGGPGVTPAAGGSPAGGSRVGNGDSAAGGSPVGSSNGIPSVSANGGQVFSGRVDTNGGSGFSDVSGGPAGGGGPIPTGHEKPVRARQRFMRRVAWMAIPLALVFLILLFLHGEQPSPQAQDYVFNSKKTVTSGLPNSVIFNYDASRSPDDSVVIQQSWDTTRRVKVPKTGHAYTSIYYYPDFYHATLQVHGKVVKTHNLLIKTDGWLPLVEQDPVPVYFHQDDVMEGGKMRLTVDQIKQKNILLQPHPPTVMFANVNDFGDIYSDNFVFETALKNDYAEGSNACELTRIYLLCQGTAIWIPLVSKGCVSNVDLFFTYYYTSGTRDDLSNFGVDFKNYVKLRIQSDSGKAQIFVDNKLAYTVPRHIIRAKIIGIMYRFEGTGSVDYASLTNGKVSYRDDF